MISLEDYDKALKEFQKKYGQTPGIISIEDDKWDGSMIVVIVDFAKFDKQSLPETYLGADVFVVDVYKERDSFKEMISNLRSQYPELDESSNNFQFFVRRAELLDKTIQDYEKRK